MKLVPCPFCRHSNPVITSNGIGDFFVICSDNVEEGEYPGCGARTSDVRCESEEHAAERWNMRSNSADTTMYVLQWPSGNYASYFDGGTSRTQLNGAYFHWSKEAAEYWAKQNRCKVVSVEITLKSHD